MIPPNMPLKVMGNFMVEDWTSDQDPGDEDDGLLKAIQAALKKEIRYTKTYEFDNFYF